MERYIKASRNGPHHIYQYVKNRKPCEGLNRILIARNDDLEIIYDNSTTTGKGSRGITDPIPIEDDILDIDTMEAGEDFKSYGVNDTMAAGEEINKGVEEYEAA